MHSSKIDPQTTQIQVRKHSENKYPNQSSPQKSLTTSSFKVLFENNDDFKIPNRLEKGILIIINFIRLKKYEQLI